MKRLATSLASAALLLGAPGANAEPEMTRATPVVPTLERASPRESDADGTVALNLYVGQARVLQAGDVRRIVIGNGKVIQATALDDGQVLVIPESPGQSTLHLWGKDGVERGFVVTVIAADAARILSEIRAMLGAATNLSARVVGDKIVIEGGNLTEEQAARLVEVGKRYPQIVNLVSRVGFERMIAIDVRMVEMRRDQLENIGIRWSGSATGPNVDVVGDLHRSRALQPGGSAEGAPGVEVRQRVAPFATALGLATSITSMINLMVQNGDAVVLAEPSLSCRSGGSARFHAGGELPIPFSSGLGNVSVVFKEYGVKFDVNPLASETGVIAAKVAAEISSINFDVVVKEVPGITKRRAETEVNLRENETLIIAGLIAEESSRSIDRVPALGELPVLGQLFRSRAFRDRQSELVVFITPRFVDPLPPRPTSAVSRGNASGGLSTSSASGASAAPAPEGARPQPPAAQPPDDRPEQADIPPYDPWLSPPPSPPVPKPAEPPPSASPPAQRYTPTEVDRRTQQARERVRMVE